MDQLSAAFFVRGVVVVVAPGIVVVVFSTSESELDEHAPSVSTRPATIASTLVFLDMDTSPN